MRLYSHPEPQLVVFRRYNCEENKVRGLERVNLGRTKPIAGSTRMCNEEMTTGISRSVLQIVLGP